MLDRRYIGDRHVGDCNIYDHYPCPCRHTNMGGIMAMAVEHAIMIAGHIFATKR